MLRLDISAPKGAPVRGKALFDMAMEHYAERVKAIQGNWLYGSNLEQFNFNRDWLGMGNREAATNTFTGQSVARWGFAPTKIDIVPSMRDGAFIEYNGNAEAVMVLFDKAPKP